MIARSYCACACDSMWERDGLEGIIISFIRSTGIIGKNGEEECIRSCCFFPWLFQSDVIKVTVIFFFSLQIFLLLNQRLLLPVQVFLWFSLSRYVQLCLDLPIFFQRPTPVPMAGFWLILAICLGSSRKLHRPSCCCCPISALPCISQCWLSLPFPKWLAEFPKVSQIQTCRLNLLGPIPYTTTAGPLSSVGITVG